MTGAADGGNAIHRAVICCLVVRKAAGVEFPTGVLGASEALDDQQRQPEYQQ